MNSALLKKGLFFFGLLSALGVQTGGAVTSISLAADLPYHGGSIGVPSLIGELTIRDATGRESYTFRQGDPIHFELTVRSVEDEPVRLQYTSGARHSFTVVSENVDAVVWWSLTGLGFIQIIMARDIAPRAIETYSAKWDQKYVDSARKSLGPVKPGVYRVIAEDFGRLPGDRV